MITDNRVVVDLKKVAYARYFYRSKDYNHVRNTKPTRPTVHGVEINEDDCAFYHIDFPNEKLIERAKRLDVIDKWISVLVLVLCNGHKLEYTGKKAKELKDTFNAKIFKL